MHIGAPIAWNPIRPADCVANYDGRDISHFSQASSANDCITVIPGQDSSRYRSGDFVVLVAQSDICNSFASSVAAQRDEVLVNSGKNVGARTSQRSRNTSSENIVDDVSSPAVAEFQTAVL